MNKYLIFTIVIFSGIFLNGCDDFLTAIPDSAYSVDGSYKSQADFESAIAAAYSRQQKLYSSAGWDGCRLRDIIARSDETLVDISNVLYLNGIDKFTDDDSNLYLRQYWQLFWLIISRCNLILDKIDDAEFNNMDMKDYIKGEAYILRAYCYWNLAWQFGGMPLIKTSLTVNETKKLARSSQEETLASAASDYENAIELLPEEWSSDNEGRATKYAAEGMLARLYLFQSNFSAALPLLNDIIVSGKYAMEGNYTDCFIDSHDNGPERVWEAQFIAGPKKEGQEFTTGCLPSAFYDPDIMPFSGYSTAMSVSDSLYYAYESGDIRRDLSILKGWNNGGTQDTVSKYIIKYTYYEETPTKTYGWANNLPILRYTDVKMMYAEALNETGYVANGEAFNILNEVRARAGLNPLTSVDLPDQSSFRNAIIKERRFEFAFEGLRWLDLIRWGIAKEVMNNFLASPLNGGGTYSMDDHQTIFAIPADEISRYGDETIMWQNPGY